MNRQRTGRSLALAVALTGGLAVIGVAAPTAHAQASCDAATFTIDGTFDTDGYLACLSGSTSTPTSAKPGASIVVVLSGFAAGETVKIVIEGLTTGAGTGTNGGIGTVGDPIIAKADTTGTVRVSVKMPSAEGTYRITGTGATSGKVVSTQVLVSANAAGGSPLPQTGSDTLRVTAVGLGLVVLGGGTVIGARRRRRLIAG